MFFSTGSRYSLLCLLVVPFLWSSSSGFVARRLPGLVVNCNCNSKRKMYRKINMNQIMRRRHRQVGQGNGSWSTLGRGLGKRVVAVPNAKDNSAFVVAPSRTSFAGFITFSGQRQLKPMTKMGMEYNTYHNKCTLSTICDTQVPYSSSVMDITRKTKEINWNAKRSRNWLGRKNLSRNGSSRLYVQSIPSPGPSSDENEDDKLKEYQDIDPKIAFDRIISRGDDTIKWGRYGDDILPLWVADMDFAAADCIQDALQERLDHGVFGYTQPNLAVEETVVSYLKNKHDYSIERDQIFFIHGLNPGMTVLAKSLQYSRPQANNVMVNTPIYPPFLWTPKTTSTLKVTQIPLQYTSSTPEKSQSHADNKDPGKDNKGHQVEGNKRWMMDLVQIEEKMKQCNEIYVNNDDSDKYSSNNSDGNNGNIIGMFLLCNPHNPVGTCFQEEELVQLGRLCGKYNILLVSDEVHCDLLLPSTKGRTTATTEATTSSQLSSSTKSQSQSQSIRKHLSVGALLHSEKYKNDHEFQKLSLVSLHAPSKTFNVPGLMCAYMIVDGGHLNQKTSKEMTYIKQAAKGFVTEVNPFGYTALDAAYKYGDAWKDACVNYLAQNRDYTMNFIDKNIPEISYYDSHEATYLLWLNVEKLDLLLKENHKKDPQSPLLQVESQQPQFLQGKEGKEQPPTSQQFFLKVAKVAVNEGIDFGNRGHVRLNFACPRQTLEEGLGRLANAIDQLRST